MPDTSAFIIARPTISIAGQDISTLSEGLRELLIVENISGLYCCEALAHTVPLTSQEAQAEAEAFFKMSARRFVVGHGLATINSKLRVGSYVELLNLGPLFSGKYYLTEVKHLFDEACGIRREFTVDNPCQGREQG